MAKLTYGQLDQVLRRLNFAARIIDGARMYRHESGASITIPYFPDEDPLLERHRVPARAQVEMFGVASGDTFDEMLFETRPLRRA